MAGHVIASIAGRCRAAVLPVCFVMLGTVCTAWAAGPAAPFVPPVLDPSSLSVGADGASAAGNGAAASGLTGVRLGRQGGAVIDGQWVRLGAQVRGARLVSVQRSKVVLKHPDGHKEIIEMYPPQGGQAGASAPASTEAVKP